MPVRYTAASVSKIQNNTLELNLKKKKKSDFSS